MEPEQQPQPQQSENKWVATFKGGAILTVEGDYVWLDDPDEDSPLRFRLEETWVKGWPELAGWTIDTSPGFDPEWNYLRLVALGATSVVGPFPQQHMLDEPIPEGTIVG
jgi:hypothetical protein